MITMYNPKIDELIESWREDIYQTLKGWIAIDSPSSPSAGEGKPFGENVRKVLDLALSDAEKMGFSVRNIDGYAGEINLGSGEQTMGMLAHLDIVPAGDGWAHDPFGGEGGRYPPERRRAPHPGHGRGIRHAGHALLQGA